MDLAEMNPNGGFHDFNYTKLAAYTRLGPADVVMLVQTGSDSIPILGPRLGSLPTHLHLLSIFSPFMRDIITSTTKDVDPVSGLLLIPLEGDCVVDWLQAMTAMYMCTEGVNEDEQWRAMLVERPDQDQSALALDLLASKYNIPAVAKLARQAMCLSLRSSTRQPSHTPWGKLDPWILAHRSFERNDVDLYKRSLSTICEPLERDRSVRLPPATLKSWLGPVVGDLLSEINNSVATACSKHRTAIQALNDNVTILTSRNEKLKASSGMVQKPAKYNRS